ncbi:hypothetical protein HanRHA438_Chr06g0267861 [Helianthus annuus]|nr:hypothetical protein HanRHA438_Chr06g0267861 [Helianthus annuus]
MEFVQVMTTPTPLTQKPFHKNFFFKKLISHKGTRGTFGDHFCREGSAAVKAGSQNRGP